MDNYVSNPILTDCVFTRNTVGVLPNDFFGGGAGMGNFLSSPILRNCTFTKNRGISGGGIYNEYSNPTLTNCMFVGNQAYVHDGGAIWNLSSSPTLTNCTFSGNKGGQGGAIFCADGSNATVTDCILWDDWAVDGNEIALHAGFQEGASSLTVSYSDIQGGATGVYVGGDSRINWEAGNIDDDPNFVQRGRWDPNGFWLAGDYHLLAGSPCIDAGAPNSDWGYEPWPNGGRVNMGAYGNTREATRSSADFEDLAQICAYWLEYDPLLDIAPEPAGDGVINFLDFAVFANCWLW
jgi:predicted outer membrane repeat protein